MNTKETFTYYNDFLENDEPVLERSRIYNISPIGLGTYKIESLHSYLLRLAKYHQVSVWKLLETEASDLFTKGFLREYVKKRQTNHVHYINGCSEITEDYLNVLEILTKRDDLINLTLLNGRGLFSTKRNVLREYRAWCPVCFEEWKKNDNELYEPLIWSIKFVDFCPDHLARLQDECPSCGNKNRMISSNQSVGYCGKCGQWLGDSYKIVDEIIEEWDYWCVLNFRELLEFFQESNFVLLGNYSTNIIKMLVEQYTAGNVNEFSRLLNIGMMKDYVVGRYNIAFEKLLNLSFYFNTSIVDLIKYTPIDKNKINYSALDRLENKQHQYYDVNPDELRRELQDILDSNNSPPLSMSQVIKTSKYSTYILYKYGKDLCEKITLKRKQYLREQKIKKQIALKEKIRSVVKELLKEGTQPTEWFVFNRLEENVYKEETKEILDDVLIEMNINNI